MPIEFHCEACTKLLRVPDGSGGKQCQCPSCGALLTIPAAAPNPPGAALRSSAQEVGSDLAMCIPCPKCKHELICSRKLMGTKGQCRSCKHIFVITDLPTAAGQAVATSIKWVFSCPKCSQLFEGSEPMRGRRGKCHACGEVFAIELRVADSAPAIPQQRSDRSSTHRLATQQTTAPAYLVSRAASKDLAPLQFNCTNCKGRMEVRGSAARQLTYCPHCRRQQTIPAISEPLTESLIANDFSADLGSFGGAPADLLQIDPLGASSYPPSLPVSTSRSYAKKRVGGAGGKFIACGVCVASCAFIAIVIEILEIVLWSMVVAVVPDMNDPRMLQGIVTISAAFFMLVLSIIQMIGGILLARRRVLGLARTAAVLCCLPCLCVLNMPFGVWACILTFGSQADREFR